MDFSQTLQILGFLFRIEFMILFRLAWRSRMGLYCIS
jgi:hypothetical protein